MVGRQDTFQLIYIQKKNNPVSLILHEDVLRFVELAASEYTHTEIPLKWLNSGMKNHNGIMLANNGKNS